MLTPPQAKRVASELLSAPPTRPCGGSEQEAVPERIGAYRICRVIGSGGMGTVYEAEQAHPHRTVAIKVLKRSLTFDLAAERFDREVELMAHLRHPGIAHIYDAGTYDDGGGATPYFAMEFVPGAQTIVGYAESKKLSIRARVKLFVTVCDAVHHGHRKTIIHRDLKPANLLVDETGHVKIIDFGVARATNSDVATTAIRTEVGQIIGTLQYMSPEQCEGEPHALDVRSDVYSLGVVLYELLCGQLPYDLSGTSVPGATRRIQEQQPPRPSTIRRKLRGALETILLKSLRKDRTERYDSASALAADLRHYLRGEPLDAHDASAWARSVRWLVAHPLVGTLAACVTLFGLTLAATKTYSQWVLWQPYEIELAPDQRKARLLSRAGNPLHTWDTGNAASISFAEIVDPHPGLSERVALIAFNPHRQSRYEPGLTAFDLDDPATPLWTIRITDDDLLPQLRDDGLAGDEFYVSRVYLEDVFLDPPGPEIITIHQHTDTACVLRIHDFNEKLLYEIWHQGHITGLYWMAGVDQLAVCGLNGEVALWDRGFPSAQKAHPIVVFSLLLERHHRGETWLGTSGSDGPDSPVWYWYLLPAASARDLFADPTMSRPMRNHDPSRSVQFSVGAPEHPNAAVHWVLDHQGRVIAGSRVVSNGYRLAERNGLVPPAREFSLGELRAEPSSRETTEPRSRDD